MIMFTYRWKVAGADYSKQPACRYYETCVLFMENWRPIKDKSSSPSDMKNWQTCKFLCNENKIFDTNRGHCATPAFENSCVSSHHHKSTTSPFISN